MNPTATLHSLPPSAGRASGIGPLLRTWRQRRRLSQMALALEAEVSARHLSFVESGRAQPSRDMVLHLAERLDVPLRERNALLVAAGYAPLFRERPFSDPQLDAARGAVEAVLRGHEPYPALAVDRHWTLLAANRMLGALVAQADPALLQPPVNVLRLSLHPDGLASQIVNWHEWRAHILHRLQRQIDASGDRTLHTDRTRLLIVRQNGGNVALLVDEVFGQRTVDQEQRTQAMNEDDPRLVRFVDGRVGEQQLAVFSMNRLVRAPDFRQAAA